jgi:hypothetical protein
VRMRSRLQVGNFDDTHGSDDRFSRQVEESEVGRNQLNLFSIDKYLQLYSPMTFISPDTICV